MGRSPCCSKVGLRRGPWSAKEDSLLTDYIQQNGEGQWRSLPKKAGLLRCGKGCRLRWMNYLRPGIVRGNITEDEEDLILRLHGLLGNRWSLIAGRLSGRTDNEIKNYWNTHLLKKLNTAAGVHPVHRRPDLPKPDGGNGKAKQKKKTTAAVKVETSIGEDHGGDRMDVNPGVSKTKVYSPKAIRVSSSEFPRSNSYDSLSLVSKTSSSESPEEWPPLFELEGSAGEEDFLTLPMLDYLDSMSEDVNRVYDEYLQLL